MCVCVCVCVWETDRQTDREDLKQYLVSYILSRMRLDLFNIITLINELMLLGRWSEFNFHATGRFVHTPDTEHQHLQYLWILLQSRRSDIGRHSYTYTSSSHSCSCYSCCCCYPHQFDKLKGICQLVPKSLLGHCLNCWWSEVKTFFCITLWCHVNDDATYFCYGLLLRELCPNNTAKYQTLQSLH